MRVSVVVTALVILAMPQFVTRAGQRPSPNDVLFDIPGLRAEPVLPALLLTSCSETTPPYNQLPDPRCFRAFGAGQVDATGSFYYPWRTANQAGSIVSEIWRTRRDGVIERVAHIGEPQGSGDNDNGAAFGGLYADLVRGELYVLLSSGCGPSAGPPCEFPPATELFRIVGLDALPDVLHDLPQHSHENNGHGK